MTTNNSAGGPPLRRPTLVISNSARFDIGQLVATPGALALLEQTGFSAAALVNRHIHGDWGDLDKADAANNEYALKHGMPLVSIYRLVDPLRLAITAEENRWDLPTIWIFTEGQGDRRTTSILRPEDY